MTFLIKGYDCLSNALIVFRKEIVELQTKMNQEEFKRLSSEKSLYEARIELKRWRIQAQSLESENIVLKQTVEDLKIKKSAADINVEEQDDKKTSQQQPKVPDNSNNVVERQASQKLNKNIQLETEKTNNVTTLSKNLLSNSLLPRNKKFSFNKETENFIQQRTLTVIESDMSSGNSSSTETFDISFEEFDDDLSLKKPFPELISNNLESQTKKIQRVEEKQDIESQIKKIQRIEVKQDIESPTIVANKENIVNNPVKATDNIETTNKLKRKVAFSEDTVDKNENRKRPTKGGNILVPKKIIYSSTIAKKI